MRDFHLRIFRRWTWESAVPMSEIRLGGRNPVKLKAHDELQYSVSTYGDDDNERIWKPVQIVEAEKPENPQDAEDREERERMAAEIMKAVPSVDRSQQTLTDGRPVTADHREIEPATGMQKAYVVLSAEERAKGFVQPVRQKYVHKPCGVVTHMGLALAETYARDPKFYNGTFCCGCRKHFPLDQFVWDGTNEQIGS